MTTVAAKDGLMAADSRITDEHGAFATRLPKIFRLANGALLGCAGGADFRDVVKLLGVAKTPKGLPSRKELAELKCEYSGLLLMPKGQLFFVDIWVHEMESDSEWAAQIVECHERFSAVGSGHQFAIGAMASGKTAAQSVAIACRYDTASGLPVRQVQLKP